MTLRIFLKANSSQENKAEMWPERTVRFVFLGVAGFVGAEKARVSRAFQIFFRIKAVLLIRHKSHLLVADKFKQRSSVALILIYANIYCFIGSNFRSAEITQP